MAFEAPEHRTEAALGLHGIGRDDATLHLAGLQPGFDGTDLILFLAHLMLSQHDPGACFIEGKQRLLTTLRKPATNAQSV